MTNTIPSVPRELLRDIETHLDNIAEFDPTYAPDTVPLNTSAELLIPLRALLSAPSPAGVDGLEVVAYRKPYMSSTDFMPHEPWCNDGISSEWEPLCRLSDAQAIIDGLRGEVADLLSMLATVSKAGLRVRTQRDQQSKRIGELEGLLRDSAELIKHGVFEDGYCCCGSSVDSHGLGDGHSPVDALAYHAGQVCERIDAALSAGKGGE